MEDFISRDEHKEFVKRMEGEHHRQNERIELLEENVRQINDLTVSVKEMAVSMKSMLAEQQAQGDRLEVLESRDGEMWRKVVGHLVTVAVGIFVGYIFTQLGF